MENFSEMVKRIKGGTAGTGDSSFREMVKRVKGNVAEPGDSSFRPTVADNLKSLAGEVHTGIGNASKSMWQTIDFLTPDELIDDVIYAFGGEENTIGQFFDQAYAVNEQENRKQAERRAKADETTQKIGQYIVQPVAQALPNALVSAGLAYMTGGVSLGAQALGSAGASASGYTSVIQKAGKAVMDILKNPSFWTSFSQTAGPTYFDAKEKGANEVEATVTALLNGFAGSAIEVGGGIETLPNTEMGIRQFVHSMLDEGKEEVLQGITEGLISKAVYDHDKEWASFTDQDAIFSGTRAAQEFAGGVTVGGILGGGQIGAMTAVSTVNKYVAASSVGNMYLRGEDGNTIEDAIEIGFSNAKGTDMYRAAETIAQKVSNRERVSPYVVGRMVIESCTPKAQRARALDIYARRSASRYGVSEDVADDIARIAVATDRVVEFVPAEQLQVYGANGTSVAEGRYSAEKIQLNASLDAERLKGYLIKHELAHSIENTKQWEQLKQIVLSFYGEVAFESAVDATIKLYAKNNEQLTREGAEREVIAQWIGENLFKDGFAQALANGNASVGNAFLQILDKIRLSLGGTKNSRTAGDIALVERLFMRAMESKQTATESRNEVYSLSFGTEKQNDTKVVVRLITENGHMIDAENKFSVPLENDAQAYAKKSEYVLAVFDSQGNMAYNPQIGNVELRRAGAKSTIAHGFGNVKLASVHAIKDVIEKGNIISKEDNYNGTGVTRYVIAARGQIGNKPACMGVVVKSYPNNTIDAKFYLHEATIIETDSYNMTAPPLGWRTVNEPVSNTNIPQDGTGVNRYDMQNGGGNSQFSFGRVNGKNIDVEFEGSAPVGAVQNGAVENTANSQAVVDLSDDTELAQRVKGIYGSEKYKRIQAYILEVLGDQPVTLSDGKLAIVDRSDALHIANKSGTEKTAHLSKIKELVETAKLYAEDNNVEHNKFDYFCYYRAEVRYGNETFPIYLNVGRGINDGQYHLYDVTKNIRDTANRINGLERPKPNEGYALENDVSIYSIRNPETEVKENVSTEGVTVETAPVEHTADEHRKVAQGRTVEALEQELSDRELFNRAYMSEQIDRPPATVTIGGAEVDTAAYMNMVEDTLPDTEEGLQAFIEDTTARHAREITQQYEETGEVEDTVTAAQLQLIAADRKLTRIKLLDGETDGDVFRRFFEQRLKNLDTNRTHADEMVAYLAGRSENYSPISNQKTLEEAQARLRQDGYARKIERRIKRYRPGQTLNSVELAAAQVMINDAKNNGDFELFADLIQGVSRYGTELGRAVQILSLQKRLTPEGTIKAVKRTMQRAVDAQHGEGTADSIDAVSSTIVDAIERVDAENGVSNMNSDDSRTRVVPEGLTVDQLETALGDAIVAEKSPYITEEEIRGIIRRAVDGTTDMSAHLKKMLKNPKVQNTLAEKIAEIHKNGHLTDANIRAVMEEALGLPTLSTEDVTRLVEMTEALQNTEPGTLEWHDAQETIYRFLGAKLPVSKLEVLMSWRKFAMLANPKTHFRNMAANTAMLVGVNKADAAFATLFQRMFLRDESQRTAYIGWRGTQHGKQLLQGDMFDQQADKALARLRGDEKYEFTDAKLGRYKKTFGRSKVGEALNKASDFNSNMLELEDAIAFKPVFKDALGQIMTARKATVVTDEIFEAAYQTAAETVFRADNAVATVLAQLKQGMFDVNTAKGKRALGFIADIVIPFSKTPANIAVSSFQHSPLGYVKSAYDLVQTLRGAPNAKTMADVINGFAKNTTGLLLLGVGLLLGNLGLFNTGYGKTEKERAADELAGIQENALVIGNFSITLDWLQPAASPLIVGASIAQRLREDGLSLSAVGGAVMDGTDSLFELTMLQSLYDVLGGYDAGASASAASVFENTISQSIPTLVGQAARAIDPVQRKTRGDNGFETVINQIMAKIPGLTYLLEPELDVWGNEVYRTGKVSAGNAVVNAIQQFLLPFNFKSGTGSDDVYSQMVLDLYGSDSKNAGRAIPAAVTRDDAKELGVDYHELLRAVSQLQRERLEELVDGNGTYTVQVIGANGKKRNVKKRWAEMTDDERLIVMNRTYNQVRRDATDPESELYDEIIGGLRNGN